MKRKCPSYKYTCIDGKCVTSIIKCNTNRKKCRSMYRRYFCGEDNGNNCVSSDPMCMRPCGFSQIQFDYNITCPGYPGKCAYKAKHCPKKCGANEVRCSSGQCAPGINWCGWCSSGYRCKDNGKCFSVFQRCNDFKFCSDGSDETNCPTFPDGTTTQQDSGYGTVEMLVGSLGAAILITLMILRGWWKLNKSRRRHQEEAAILATNRQFSRQVPGGPVVSGSLPAYEMPNIAVPSGNSSFPTQTMPSSYPLPNYSMTGAPMEHGGIPGPASLDSVPPPAYSEVVSNEDRYKRTDPELPTYDESVATTRPQPPPT